MKKKITVVQYLTGGPRLQCRITPLEDPFVQIEAYVAHKCVGRAVFEVQKKYVYGTQVFVKKSRRRKGVATAMYRCMHQATGLTVRPTKELQTREGALLWESLKRWPWARK